MKRLLGLVFFTLCVCFAVSFFAYAEEYEPIVKTARNGHDYAVYDVSLNWNDAKAYCESIGGHLVTITSETEQDAVVSILNELNYTKQMYWLGGYESDGRWRWINNEEFKYENWNPGEPTGGQHYMTMLTQLAKEAYPRIDITFGKWLDNPSNGNGKIEFTLAQTGFICEWDSTESIQPNAVNTNTDFSEQDSTENIQPNATKTSTDNSPSPWFWIILILIILIAIALVLLKIKKNGHSATQNK